MNLNTSDIVFLVILFLAVILVCIFNTKKFVERLKLKFAIAKSTKTKPEPPKEFEVRKPVEQSPTPTRELSCSSEEISLDKIFKRGQELDYPFQSTQKEASHSSVVNYGEKIILDRLYGKKLTHRYDDVELHFASGKMPDLASLDPGMDVDLIQEPDNEHDPNAVYAEVDGQNIGYLQKGKLRDLVNDFFSNENPIVSHISSIFETTGLSPENDTIIEVGMIKVINGTEIDNFSSLVNPGRPIPVLITCLTGISDIDVVDSPTEVEISKTIHEFIGNLPVVAHNASFDICSLYRRAGLAAKITSIDTLQLARKAFPDAPNHKLSTLIRWLSLGTEQEHMAFSDVRFTNALLKKCLERTDYQMKRQEVKLPPIITKEHIAIATWARQTLVAAGKDIQMLGFELHSKYFKIVYFYTVLDIKLGGKLQYVLIQEKYTNLVSKKLLTPCPKSEGGPENMRFLFNEVDDLEKLKPVLLAAHKQARLGTYGLNEQPQSRTEQTHFPICRS